MKSSRAKLLIQQWTAQGHIPPDKVQSALEIADITPNHSQWRQFLDKLLLANGGGLFLFGVVFFFAFNWQEITRFHKFAMIEALVVASLWAYSHWFIRPSAKVFVLAAAVFVGVLLAFFGQTYQTGADTWQLFATWAILITPWAFLAQLGALWLLWLILVNLSIVLYFQVFHGLFGVVFSSNQLQLAMFVFNTTALLLWEFFATRLAWLYGRNEVRLLAVASGFSVTWLMLEAIFSHNQEFYWIVVAYPLWLLIGYTLYRQRIPDLFMLAGGALTLIVISTAFLGKEFLNKQGDFFLVLAMWVVMWSSLAIRWLQKIAKEGKHE